MEWNTRLTMVCVALAGMGGAACAAPLATIKPQTHYTEALPSEWNRLTEITADSKIKLGIVNAAPIDARLMSADAKGITVKNTDGSQSIVAREAVTNIVLKGGNVSVAHAKRGVLAGLAFAVPYAYVAPAAFVALPLNFAMNGAVFGVFKHKETLVFVAPPAGPAPADVNAKPAPVMTWPGVTALKARDNVRVEIEGAPSAVGTFESATAEEITILQAGSKQQATFQRESISRVVVIRNRAKRQARGGAIIGAATYGGFTAAVFGSFADYYDCGARCYVGGAMVGALVGALGGGAIGATNGADEMIETPVYVKSKTIGNR
jgi:hypothetical protein